MTPGDQVRSKHDGEAMTVKKVNGSVVVCVRHTKEAERTMEGERKPIAIMSKENLELVEKHLKPK